MMAWRIGAWTALVLCTAFALSAAREARALELNDLIIEFDTVSTYEIVEPGRDVSRNEPDQWPKRIDVIAGNLVWQTGSGLCMNKTLSLVYKRGAHHGSVDCPVERKGTSTDWYERGATATFDTTMSIAGTIVTLAGTMKGSGVFESSSCGDVSAKEIETVHTQSLKIKISGNRCQVLEYQDSMIEEESLTEGHGAGTVVKRTSSSQLAPGGACVVKRRSQQPISEPGEGLVDAVRKCGN